MPFSPLPPPRFPVQKRLRALSVREALPLPHILGPAQVEQRFAEYQVSFGQLASALWTPALTLWAFLFQAISADHSCRHAVWPAS